jgi:hypothetical protein
LAVAVSLPASSAIQSRPINVVVASCYTDMSKVRVSIDGQGLELTPPTQRNDSIGLCFGRVMKLGRHISVVLIVQDRTESFALNLNARSKTVLIAAREMTASVREKPVMFD